eukprot:1183281-Prorocentrum_minimum.AAC.2
MVRTGVCPPRPLRRSVLRRRRAVAEAEAEAEGGAEGPHLLEPLTQLAAVLGALHKDTDEHLAVKQRLLRLQVG